MALAEAQSPQSLKSSQIKHASSPRSLRLRESPLAFSARSEKALLAEAQRSAEFDFNQFNSPSSPRSLRLRESPLAFSARRESTSRRGRGRGGMTSQLDPLCALCALRRSLALCAPVPPRATPFPLHSFQGGHMPRFLSIFAIFIGVHCWFPRPPVPTPARSPPLPPLRVPHQSARHRGAATRLYWLLDSSRAPSTRPPTRCSSPPRPICSRGSRRPLGLRPHRVQSDRPHRVRRQAACLAPALPLERPRVGPRWPRRPMEQARLLGDGPARAEDWTAQWLKPGPVPSISPSPRHLRHRRRCDFQESPRISPRSSTIAAAILRSPTTPSAATPPTARRSASASSSRTKARPTPPRPPRTRRSRCRPVASPISAADSRSPSPSPAPGSTPPPSACTRSRSTVSASAMIISPRAGPTTASASATGPTTSPRSSHAVPTRGRDGRPGLVLRPRGPLRHQPLLWRHARAARATRNHLRRWHHRSHRHRFFVEGPCRPSAHGRHDEGQDL